MREEKIFKDVGENINKDGSEYYIESVKEKVKKEGKSSLWENLFLLIVSILIFFSAGLIKWSLVEIIILIFVIFVHELGHLIAMLIFGYKNPKILFIPFVGAIVSGKEKKFSRVRSAIVSLAGPLPGILIGMFLILINIKYGNRIIEQLGITFVFINAFNLLPFYPLDGGRFIEDIFLYKNKYLEIIFKGGAILLLGIFFVLAKSWILAFLSVIWLSSLRLILVTWKIYEKMKEKAYKEFSYSENIPDEFVEKAIKIHRSLPKKTELDEKNMAFVIKDVWKRLFSKKASPAVTISMIMVYLIVFVFVLFSMVVFAYSPKNVPDDFSKWKIYENNEFGFKVKFPGEPKEKIEEEKSKWSKMFICNFSYETRGFRFILIKNQLPSLFYFGKTDFLKEYGENFVNTIIDSDLKIKYGKFGENPGLEFSGKKGEMLVKGRLIIDNLRLFLIMGGGERKYFEENYEYLEYFMNSFEIIKKRGNICERGSCIDGKGSLIIPFMGRYRGDFEDGKFNGEGVLYFLTGERYEGEFKDGEAEGKGTLFFKNGDKYEGYFHKSGFVKKAGWLFSENKKKKVIWDGKKFVDFREKKENCLIKVI